MPVADALVAEINKSIDKVVVDQHKQIEQQKTQSVPPAVTEKPKEESKSVPFTPEVPAVTETPAVEVKQRDAAVKQTPAVIKPETVPVATPAVISDDVIVRAVRAGLSLADARSFSSEDSLGRVIERLESINRESVKKPPAAKKEAEDIFKDLPTLDPETYEPDIIKTFEALKTIIKKQGEVIQSYGQQTDSINKQNKETQQEATNRWFDSKIADLGKDFESILGAGATNALPLGSSQAAKRDEIANKTAALLTGYRATGQKLPSKDVVFEEAARIVLKDEYVKAQEARLQKQIEDRDSQIIARASSDTNGKATKTPQEEIAAALNEKYFKK